jgi:hypothetical protein
MKDLEYCSLCDRKLTEDDKEINREDGIDTENWLCFVCDNDSDSGE